MSDRTGAARGGVDVGTADVRVEQTDETAEIDVRGGDTPAVLDEAVGDVDLDAQGSSENATDADSDAEDVSAEDDRLEAPEADPDDSLTAETDRENEEVADTGDGEVAEPPEGDSGIEDDRSDVLAAAATAGASDGRLMIDPRGPRFGAAITVLVLAAVLLTIPSVTSVALLVLQAVVFGAAAFFGIQAQPYGMVYRAWIQPRLGPPTEREDAAPPRFAQQVGLVFVLVALVGLALNLPAVAFAATAFALAAAFLNAAFNFCLGCEIYLLVQRLRKRNAAPVA